jgi:hypothetical protein
LETVLASFERLKRQNEVLQSTVTTQQNDIVTLRQKLDCMEHALKANQEQIQSIQGSMTQHKETVKHDMANVRDQMELEARRHARRTVVFHGVTVSHQDALSAVQHLLQDVATQADIPSPAGLIVSAHQLRTSQSSEGKSPPILVELASEAHACKITALRSNLPPGVTVSKGTTPQERSRRRPQQGLFLTLLHAGYRPYWRNGSDMYYRPKDNAGMVWSGLSCGPVILGDLSTYPHDFMANSV